MIEIVLGFVYRLGCWMIWLLRDCKRVGGGFGWLSVCLWSWCDCCCIYRVVCGRSWDDRWFVFMSRWIIYIVTGWVGWFIGGFFGMEILVIGECSWWLSMLFRRRWGFIYRGRRVLGICFVVRDVWGELLYVFEVIKLYGVDVVILR